MAGVHATNIRMPRCGSHPGGLRIAASRPHVKLGCQRFRSRRPIVHACSGQRVTHAIGYSVGTAVATSKLSESW